MPSIKTITITALATSAFVATAATWVAVDAKATTAPVDDEPSPLVVRVAPVELFEKTRQYRFYGVTRPERETLASFTVGGRIEAVAVSVGDVVKAGTPIANLDAADYRYTAAALSADLKGVDARMRQARRDADRSEALTARQAISRVASEQARTTAIEARAGRRSVRSRLAAVRRRVRETVLRAPFDAIVTEVLLEDGAFAAPGTPVVRLAGAEGLEIEVELTASVARLIGKGTEVQVDVPSAGLSRIEASIERVAAASGGPGRLFPAVIALDRIEGLLPGMAAEVSIAVPALGAFRVPTRAIVDPTGRAPRVLRVEGESVEEVPVTPRGFTGEHVVIDADLDRADLLVTMGHERLVPGDRVEPIR